MQRATRAEESAGSSVPRGTADRSSAAPSRRRIIALAIGSMLLIGSLLPFDERIAHWMPRIAENGTVLRRVLKVSAHLIEWWVFVAVGVALLALPQRKQLVAGYLAALAACLGSLHLLKSLLGRARPGQNLGAFFFHPFGDLHLGFDSFPSGHAVAATVLAALLALYWPRSRWLLVPVTVLVCLNRLVLARHFTTDVIGGVALALVGVQLCRRLLGDHFYTPRRLAAGGEAD